VDEGLQQSFEFHIIGEHIPRPPRHARLELIARLRNEQKFSGLDELVAQIQTDIARAKEILKVE
jgi:riboflavin kinase/FMN adenylyltransferase